MSELRFSFGLELTSLSPTADHVNGLVGLLCTISAGEGSVLPGQTDLRIKASQAPSAVGVVLFSSPPAQLTTSHSPPTPPTRLFSRSPHQQRPTELYGPSGLREFVRLNLRLTQSVLTRPYVVHELLFEGEEEETGKLHPSEREGRNIRQENGIWKDFTSEVGVDISAGPVLHTGGLSLFSYLLSTSYLLTLLPSVNCIGYIFNELPRPLPLQPNLLIPHLQNPTNAAALLAQGVKNPLSLLSQLTRTRQPITLADGTVLSPPPMGGEGRKVVVLGDTYDASGCIGLSQGADLVVHEATNAYLPTLDESQAEGKKRDGALITSDSVRATAKEHGHSTPEVAGEFARAVGAMALVMNHLSVKYPDFGEEEQEDDGEGTRNVRRMIKEIERLASEAWGGGEARVAKDFMEVEIPRRREVSAEQQ